MPRDRRAVIGTTDIGRARCEEMRAAGTLPRYHDPHGFYERPRVQWSKGGNSTIRLAVFIRDTFACVECGYEPDHIPHNYDGTTTLGRLVVDHIIPLARGGERFALSNLQTLCRTCNGRKG